MHGRHGEATRGGTVRQQGAREVKQQGARQVSNKVRATVKQQGQAANHVMSRSKSTPSKPTPFLPPAARAPDRPRCALAPSLANAGERDLIPSAASLVDPDRHGPDGLAIEVVSKLVPATPGTRPVHVLSCEPGALHVYSSCGAAPTCQHVCGCVGHVPRRRLVNIHARTGI